MTDLISAEWVKLRSVQSSFYAVFAVALFVAMSGLIAWQTISGWDAADAADAARRADFHPSAPENGLLMFVQLCVAALGVLAVTSEYATGMIRTTLTAVPQRGSMLAAKAALIGALALVIGQVSAFAMFFLSRLIVGDRPIPGYLTQVVDEVPRLLSLGLSVMVVGLVGLGLGVITRSTTGALTGVVALLFVFPTLGQLLPKPWDERFVALTLNALPSQLAGAEGSYFSPGIALAALLGYVVLALGGAWFGLRDNDA